jgi:heptosyltransferase-2
VVQTAFLGDVVLTLPLIRQLADRFGPVDVVTVPAAVPLLATQPGIKRVIPYDKRGIDRGVLGFIRLARTLRATGYRRAYLPHRSLRSALLPLLAGIPERIGFAGGVVALSYSRRVPLPMQGHQTVRLQSLADGSLATFATPWFSLTGAERDQAATWLAARGLERAFVVLAPGARWATKRWPHYPALAARLRWPIVVVGGPEDREMGTAIEAAAQGRAYSAAGVFTLPQSAAVLERASLVITNDSVPMHLAAALGRPILAVVGPTGPAPGFEPPGPNDRVVARLGLSCRPCSAHGHDRCPLEHHRCMKELDVATVLAAARQLIADC